MIAQPSRALQRDKESVTCGRVSMIRGGGSFPERGNEWKYRVIAVNKHDLYGGLVNGFPEKE